MIRLIFSPEARDDLDEIAGHIAADNPARALSFVEELETRAERIKYAPRAYPARTDLEPSMRMAVHGRYLILFRVSDGLVEIVRIVHGRRDLKALFARD